MALNLKFYNSKDITYLEDSENGDFYFKGGDIDLNSPIDISSPDNGLPDVSTHLSEFGGKRWYKIHLRNEGTETIQNLKVTQFKVSENNPRERHLFYPAISKTSLFSDETFLASNAFGAFTKGVHKNSRYQIEFYNASPSTLNSQIHSELLNEIDFYKGEFGVIDMDTMSFKFSFNSDGLKIYKDGYDADAVISYDVPITLTSSAISILSNALVSKIYTFGSLAPNDYFSIWVEHKLESYISLDGIETNSFVLGAWNHLGN